MEEMREKGVDKREIVGETTSIEAKKMNNYCWWLRFYARKREE